MKKILALALIVGMVSMASAGPDIEFSPGGSISGNWMYQGTTSSSGVFSFTQHLDIDAVLGTQTDALYDEFVFLPNLVLTNYVTAMPGVGNGVVAADGIVEIRAADDTLLLAGTLGEGNYYAIFGTSTIYPELALDMTVTYVNKVWGSDYLTTVNVGDIYDLNLSLQYSTNFDTIITSVGNGKNGFSGSMTMMIPEPATMLILGLGSVLALRKRSR